MQKRSVSIAGHRTSVLLEEEFWNDLQAIADQRKVSLAFLIAQTDHDRKNTNLASALRLLVRLYWRAQALEKL